MTLQPSNQSLLPRTQSGFLLQNGGSVTGGVILIDLPCSGVGSITGTTTGSAVSLVEDTTGMVVNLDGTIGSGQDSMSGSYTILSTGCGGMGIAPQTGTWSASLVMPLSGNIQGAWTSTHKGAFSLSGQITQGPNTGVSNAALSGSLNVSGYCFASANILGSVSGTAVVINLVNSEGAQIGQMSGTSSLDGTSLTGKFDFLGNGPTGTLGCRAGDTGTFTLSL